MDESWLQTPSGKPRARSLGIPSGYEFSNLIDAIVATSRGEAGLSEETKATLATLPGEVEIKVFSTPT